MSCMLAGKDLCIACFSKRIMPCFATRAYSADRISARGRCPASTSFLLGEQRKRGRQVLNVCDVMWLQKRGA
jgi:hypothetical protein